MDEIIIRGNCRVSEKTGRKSGFVGIRFPALPEKRNVPISNVTAAVRHSKTPFFFSLARGFILITFISFFRSYVERKSDFYFHFISESSSRGKTRNIWNIPEEMNVGIISWYYIPLRILAFYFCTFAFRS